MSVLAIVANRSRCFSTSHQMMRDLAMEFRASLTLPVLVQGKKSCASLSTTVTQRLLATNIFGKSGRAR
ncbi:MAG: hypothetical protein GPOALKHO_000462 [Sodalis sp.]|nr:MAG: hypothetical protein GPOALKHO_000462 [Sodalis sp.]